MCKYMNTEQYRKHNIYVMTDFQFDRISNYVDRISNSVNISWQNFQFCPIQFRASEQYPHKFDIQFISIGVSFLN